MELQIAVQDRSHFRCNVIDQKGTVSFIAPPHGLKVLAAAIAMGSRSHTELMRHARMFDAEWATAVRRDLMIFDEHNVAGVSDVFQSVVVANDNPGHKAFRIVDDLTRKRSLVPSGLGLVVFNLKEQRIIQIHNSYEDLARKGRGRVRINGEPTPHLFHYELPSDWAIVP